MLLAVSKATGQNCDCIPRIASGLQGGMGVGEVCGAISGAALAIGLLYGQDQPDAARHLTGEFMHQYAEQNGAVRCIDITGVDMGSVMGLLLYLVRGGKKKCNRVVGGAVQVLLELLEDWES